MAKSIEKLRAIKLRRQGSSIKNIASQLNISKSTVSLWCSDIELSKKQLARLHHKMVTGGHKGRMIGAAMQRERKLKKVEEYKESASKEIGAINNRDLFMVGLGLYLGEGGKSDRGFQFVNANKNIINATIEWLKYFEVSKKDLYCNVFINQSHRRREKLVVKWWSKATGIPLENFKKTIFIKSRSKKIYENHDDYYGTLALRAYKSTYLQYRILGLMSDLLYKLNIT